jgi:hypothetical protein
MLLGIGKIRDDGGTQTRAALTDAVVSEYAEAIQSGASFPPLVVFHDGTDHWLADGFHRLNAYRRLGAQAVPVDVRQGTRRDAILFSCGANGAHGLRRTNEDKRRAVETLLRDEEWCRKSNRWISERAGVSDPFVMKVRSELLTVSSSASAPSPAREGRDGKVRSLPVRREPEPARELPPPEPEAEEDEPEPESAPRARTYSNGTRRDTARAVVVGIEIAASCFADDEWELFMDQIEEAVETRKARRTKR